MIRRLPEGAKRRPCSNDDQDDRRPVHIVVDGATVEHVRAIRSRLRCSPAAVDVRRRPRFRRAALALLHDGRVLRMPGHHRRRRQSPGLPGACRRGMQIEIQHGKREIGPMNATAQREAMTSSSIGAGPAGLAAAATVRRAGLVDALFDEKPAPAARSVARSPRRRSTRTRSSSARTTGRREPVAGGCDRAAPRYIRGATVWSVTRELEIGVSIGGASRLRQGAPRDPGDRRARAAVSDSRLDAARG